MKRRILALLLGGAMFAGMFVFAGCDMISTPNGSEQNQTVGGDKTDGNDKSDSTDKTDDKTDKTDDTSSGSQSGSTAVTWAGKTAQAEVLSGMEISSAGDSSSNETFCLLVGTGDVWGKTFKQYMSLDIKINSFDGANLNSLQYEVTANWSKSVYNEQGDFVRQDRGQDVLSFSSVSKYPSRSDSFPYEAKSETVKGCLLTGWADFYTRTADVTYLMIPNVTLSNGHLYFSFEFALNSVQISNAKGAVVSPSDWDNEEYAIGECLYLGGGSFQHAGGEPSRFFLTLRAEATI